MPRSNTTTRPARRGRHRMTVADLPMTVFALACGHTGRERGIAKGDHLWCTECAATKRVAAILAQQGGGASTPR